MSVWDILITVVIAAVVILAVVKVVRDRKKGKTGCGCGCSGCDGCARANDGVRRKHNDTKEN